MNRYILLTKSLASYAAGVSTFVFIIAATSLQVHAQKTTYDDHAKPVLMQRCSSCHSGNRKEGDLDVTNYTNLMIGGGSGEVIAPGSSDDSYLYRLITHEDSPEMPPSGTKIPDSEIKVIADWINQGALENAGSKPRKSKTKIEMAVGDAATKRPEVVPMPMRMPLQPVIRPNRPSVTSIATSPWAPLAAIATPKQVLLYMTDSLELKGVLPFPEGVAHDLKFSRNGSLLMAGGGRDGQSGLVILWDVATGERIATVGEELDTVLAADIRFDHQMIALGGPQKLVKVFSTEEGSVLFELKKHTDWITAIEFSPDGKFLATGDRNGGVHVWDPEAGSEVFTLKAHNKAITSISWRPDSKVVCTASEDTSVRLWELGKGRQIKSWNAHGGGTMSAEFLRDGKIVTSGRDKVAKLWDQNGKALKQFNGLTDITMSVSYCDETNRVLCSDWTGAVQIWDSEAKLIGGLNANPPTLEERLAAAQENLTNADNELRPITEQVQLTQSKMETLSKSLDSTRQLLTEKQNSLGSAQQKLKSARQTLQSTQAEQSQWRNELEQKNKAKPIISDAVAKALQASQALPNDLELKKAADALQVQLQKIENRTTELTGLVAQSDAKTASKKVEVDSLASAVEAGQTEVNSMSNEVQQLESEVADTSKKLASESGLEKAAQAKRNAAQKDVEKWQGNLQFIEQLARLKEQLSGVESEIVERGSVVEAAMKKLHEAQELVDQARSHQQDSESAADELRSKILQLRSPK